LSATLDVRTLGEAIARALGLRSGETVEIQRDRLNPNRVLVLRVANEE
jgi:hypothetical protein